MQPHVHSTRRRQNKASPTSLCPFSRKSENEPFFILSPSLIFFVCSDCHGPSAKLLLSPDGLTVDGIELLLALLCSC